jgi:hypothetical protein
VTRLNVSRADFTLEAVYQRPAFGTFRDGLAMPSRLFEALERHGLKLNDIKLERGNGSFGDYHVFCQLFDFRMTVRVRLERVEIIGVQLTDDNVKDFAAASVDALTAVREHLSSDYRAYGFSLNLHGTLDGLDVTTYLAQFVTKKPMFGPVSGVAVAYYFGPSDDRLMATITLDVSALVPGGIYVRPQATWDGSRVTPDLLPSRGEDFVRLALAAIDLELPVRQ